MIKFAHTNIITDDWKKLSDFYINVFECRPLPPERDLVGGWLDNATGISNAHIKGIHLVLPGFDHHGPTLEIFQYERNAQNIRALPNLKGFGHIAFKVDNVQSLLDKLIAYGGSQVGELVETEIRHAGIITFVYARDIDGNIIELQSWK